MTMLSLACVVSLAACGKTSSAPAGNGPGKEAPAPLVEALQARKGSLPIDLRVSGVVRAQNQVQIRPEITAMVAEVLVASGDTVKKGQPLIRLDPAPQKQSVLEGQASVRLAEAEGAAASARVAELEAQASRAHKLAEQKIVSDLETETLDAQLAAAKASVGQATARVEEARAVSGARKSTLDKTVLRSPISGRAGRREAEVGMLVSPASILFVVGDLDKVIVDVPLTEKMLARARIGQEVTLRGTALGDRSVPARLARISPFLHPGSFSTTGEIDVDNKEGALLPGMFVTADIMVGQSEPSTIVPVSALWEDPRTSRIGVFVVGPPPAGAVAAPDRAADAPRPAKLVPIEVRAEGRAGVAVEGIAPGDWVVTVGQHLLAAASAPAARVRPVVWERVMEMQSLQQEDLLAGYLEKQQRLARTLGAAPPTTDARVNNARQEKVAR